MQASRLHFLLGLNGMLKPVAAYCFRLWYGDAIAIPGILVANEDEIGLYSDKKLNLGSFISAAGGPGISTPGFSASVGFDFYSYGGRVEPNNFISGTSLSQSFQLGLFSFTYTTATNAKSPLQSNGGLSIFSFDFGLKGFGYTSKIGLSKYVGTNHK